MSIDRAASLTLTIKSRGARSGLKEVGDEGKKTARDLQSSLKKALDSGLQGGIAGFKKGISQLKTLAAGAGIFAGVPAMRDLVKGSMDLEKRFRAMSGALQSGSGQFVHWTKFKQIIEDISSKSAVSFEDAATAFQTVLDDTGNIDQAKVALTEVARLNRSMGADMGQMSQAAGVAFDLYGVGANDAREALANFFSATNRGGASAEEMLATVSQLAPAMANAGITGLAAWNKSMGLMNFSDGLTKNKKEARMVASELMNTISSDVSRKDLFKKLKIGGDFEGSFEETLAHINKKMGGSLENLNQATGGNLSAMFEKYSSILNEAGGSTKNAGAALAQAINAGAQSKVSQSEIDKRHADNMKTANANIEMALNKLKEAFAKPEMMASVERLAKALPALAEAASKALEFITKNPALAAGGYLGFQALTGAGGGMLGSILKGAMGGGGAAAGAAAAGAAGTAASGAAGGMLGALAPRLAGFGPWGLAAAAALGTGAYLYANSTPDEQVQKDDYRLRVQNNLKASRATAGIEGAKILSRAGVSLGSDPAVEMARLMKSGKTPLDANAAFFQEKGAQQKFVVEANLPSRPIEVVVTNYDKLRGSAPGGPVPSGTNHPPTGSPGIDKAIRDALGR